MYIQSFKQVIVWQRSMELVREVYKIVRQLPKYETYVLSDQIRRAVISIPSNIAEGKKRKSKKEFLQYLHIAEGSSAELETQLLIVADIYSIDCAKAFSLLQEVQKMLVRFTKGLESSKS